jgi:hypothetical protein
MALQTKPRLWVWVFSSLADLSAPYLLPTMEVIWAVLTFAQSRVTKLWHLYLLRALIGFFEAPSFGGTHLIRERSSLCLAKVAVADQQSVAGTARRSCSSGPVSGSWATRSARCSRGTSRRPPTKT